MRNAGAVVLRALWRDDIDMGPRPGTDVYDEREDIKDYRAGKYSYRTN